MADEYYWTYKAASPTPSYQEALDAGAISPNTTESGWHSLTPGMRREIVHAARKKAAAPLPRYKQSGPSAPRSADLLPECETQSANTPNRKCNSSDSV